MATYRDHSNARGTTASAISSTATVDIIAAAGVATTQALLIDKMIISSEHATQGAVVVVEDTNSTTLGRFVMGARQTLTVEFAKPLVVPTGYGLRAKGAASEGSCYVTAHGLLATVVS